MCQQARSSFRCRIATITIFTIGTTFSSSHSNSHSSSSPSSSSHNSSSSYSHSHSHSYSKVSSSLLLHLKLNNTLSGVAWPYCKRFYRGYRCLTASVIRRVELVELNRRVLKCKCRRYRVLQAPQVVGWDGVTMPQGSA